MDPARRRQLWTAIAAVAIAASIAFQLVGATLTAYPVTWQVETVDRLAQDGSLDEEDTVRLEAPLRLANVSTVEVTLDWTDDEGEPDRFHLQLAAPNGTTVGEDEGTQSPLSVEDRVVPLPSRQTVEASSGEAARRQLAADHGTHTNGTWTVSVTLAEAPGTRPASGGPEVQPDGSNGFSIRVVATTYRGVVGGE